MFIPNVTKNFEHQYAEILQHIMSNGILKQNRTGVKTYTDQHSFVFIKDVADNFPILKGKEMYPKMALKELMWFFNGRNDVQWLRDRGVNYWNEWEMEDGTIGRSYGYQYRNFNGFDNLQHCIDTLAVNPETRQDILNIWNPADLDKMSLPPCVYTYHFSTMPIEKEIGKEHVKEFYLDLHVTQRSCDMFLGVPYDFLIVGWMIQIIAYLAENHKDNINNYRFTPRHIYYTLDDVHIYENHKQQCQEYLWNYNRSKDTLINCKTVPEIGEFCNPNPSENNITLDEYLKYADDEKYKSFKIHKDWQKLYGPIVAQVAV